MNAVVHVRYRLIDGWHVFTSEDVKGLYVAHQQPREAYDALPETIRALLKLNENLNVDVTPVDKFDDFLRRVRNPTPQPPVIGDRDFVLTPVAAE